MLDQISLLAQNYTVPWLITLLCVGLGVLAIIIPRPRKKFDPFLKETRADGSSFTKTVRHSAAGSNRSSSKYGSKLKKSGGRKR